jgi:hypothetical protein
MAWCLVKHKENFKFTLPYMPSAVEIRRRYLQKYFYLLFLYYWNYMHVVHLTENSSHVNSSKILQGVTDTTIERNYIFKAIWKCIINISPTYCFLDSITFGSDYTLYLLRSLQISRSARNLKLLKERDSLCLVVGLCLMYRPGIKLHGGDVVIVTKH